MTIERQRGNIEVRKLVCKTNKQDHSTILGGKGDANYSLCKDGISKYLAMFAEKVYEMKERQFGGFVQFGQNKQS